MEEKQLRDLLESVQQGGIKVEEAVDRLRSLPFESVDDFAQIDHHRALRCGFPEVIYGQGKSPEQITRIFNHMAERADQVMVTRLASEVYESIKEDLVGGTYHPVARALVLDRSDAPKKPGVMVITAGTADIPVAEEAALTAELMGNEVQRVFDVGVAGLHRLLNRVTDMQKARVIVVVAGMDGALPSVVGGLVSVPVIAVPTDTGYGASFNGVAALLTMLNSCATGVSVVNIGNGFGGGTIAAMINNPVDG